MTQPKTSQDSPLRIDPLALGGGQIGLTFCPGKQQASAMSGAWDRDLDLDLDAIARFGATAVVSAIEDHELAALGVPELGATVEARSIDWYPIAIVDGEVPGPRDQARWAYASLRLRAILRAGGRAVIHCKGGLGRTGTLAAQLLREVDGVDGEAAIAAVRAARPDTIERGGQERYVQALRPLAPAIEARLDRALACLLGGAIGDAFGYPIEFQLRAEIERRHGPAGLTELVLQEGQAIVSDDTQMTLFTGEGIIRALVALPEAAAPALVGGVYHAYLQWLATQGWPRQFCGEAGWLFGLPALHHARAPGNTCMSGLASGVLATPATPLNDSKGCGGVMRIAPAALYADRSPADAFDLAVDLAALTHGHPSGFLSAGALAYLLVEAIGGVDLGAATDHVLDHLRPRTGGAETVAALEHARTLVETGADPATAIPALGRGWVGEEALAIGLYAALIADSFEEAVALASNHDGDSDSTGSIAGQLFATPRGVTCLPQRWVRRLDLYDPILLIAHDLIMATAQPDRLLMTYPPLPT